MFTPSGVVGLQLSLDAPSITTGTGSALLLDCQDTAMVRASLVDSNGRVVPGAPHNVTFSISSGPGRVTATHNGDPANVSPSHASWTPSYYGLARAFVRTTVDASSAANLRQRMLEVDIEHGSCTILPARAAHFTEGAITVQVEASGFVASIQIPVSNDLADSPVNVAQRSVSF